jgi:hypothetical protein
MYAQNGASRCGVKQKIQGFGGRGKDLGTCLLKNRGASFSPFGYSKKFFKKCYHVTT